ncbi:DUF1810 domain-containing protein [Kozakia baliensis]|uniref:DUF1810 domain-containing protein n=1 Tax=Kozakia baliensis TaxID=153496 RepID=UPI00345BA028
MTEFTFDPHRFLEAQNAVMTAVHRELAAGKKQTHWMWFVFPQLAGLGHSSMAQRFALHSLEEAQIYLKHPVLGGRLLDCTELVLNVNDRSAHDIFGSPDDMKFHSCMTLFRLATSEDSDFQRALEKYFQGQSDHRTLALLKGQKEDSE